MADNQAQFAQWNAESQVRTWPRREHVTREVTPLLLDALALKPGERVLDIGSGGGLAAIAAAERVGAQGSVTGFDISAPLTGLASERAAEAGCANARFIAGDAQTGAIPGGPFDVMMSQFGVMFFADPVAAFRNIGAHLKDGARIAFACWQSPAKNSWFPGPVLAKYMQPPPPPPVPGAPPPPGPFAFADAAHLKGILEAAGFSSVTVEPREIELTVPPDAVADRETVEGLRLDPETTERAWADLQAFSAALRGADGLAHLRIAPQIVRASA